VGGGGGGGRARGGDAADRTSWLHETIPNPVWYASLQPSALRPAICDLLPQSLRTPTVPEGAELGQRCTHWESCVCKARSPLVGSQSDAGAGRRVELRRRGTGTCDLGELHKVKGLWEKESRAGDLQESGRSYCPPWLSRWRLSQSGQEMEPRPRGRNSAQSSEKQKGGPKQSDWQQPNRAVNAPGQMGKKSGGPN
jgi:hypothetical protein